jgi:hypothetical protein
MGIYVEDALQLFGSCAGRPPSRPTLGGMQRAILASVILGGALAAACGIVSPRSNDPAPSPPPAPSPTQTALRAAYDSCGGRGELSDNDRTLFLDMAGAEAGSGDLDADAVACVLQAISTPTYVITEMAETRALDGRQSETWNSFEASWSYHPDEGLNVLIRETE